MRNTIRDAEDLGLLESSHKGLRVIVATECSRHETTSARYVLHGMR
jgi:hypothetical protein